MSSEKVVQGNLCKLFQKVPASFHLYIFIQLDEKSRLQHSAVCTHLDVSALTEMF